MGITNDDKNQLDEYSKHLLITTATIKDGKLTVNERNLFLSRIKKISSKIGMDNPLPVVLTISKDIDQRTISQNKYYWGVVVPNQIDCFAEYIGNMYTKNEVHEFNKATFFSIEYLVCNEVVRMPSGSSLYDKEEFFKRIEKLRQYFIEKFDWYIPLPNEIGLPT